MKTSKINLLWKITVFIFGLSNVIPSRYSIYDEYLIPLVVSSLDPSNHFFLGIKIGITFFRVMRFVIFAMTIYQGYKIHKYAKQHNVFGYRDAFYKRE
ncbi:hypothetical protein HOK76_06490 [archaeon]|jgi:hypothetical protein|nr:hypothetical protein [archaeon]